MGKHNEPIAIAAMRGVLNDLNNAFNEVGCMRYHSEVYDVDSVEEPMQDLLEGIQKTMKQAAIIKVQLEMMSGEANNAQQ